MHRLKAFIRLVFGFSQSEANGFIVLLPLMLLIMFSEPIFRSIALSGKPDKFRDQALLDSLVSTFRWDVDSAQSPTPTRTLFPFDPNTVSKEEMITLGINEKTAARIENYRNKGGRFRKRDDLQKMYGIDSSTYQSLVPYIKLPEQYVYPTKDSQVATRERPQKAVFDLNLADSATLKSVYGIGPVMAKRIISYRSKLGGFINKEQLFEVWGLDSIAAKRLIDRSFITTDFVPVKLNINQADEPDLAVHPYIRWKLAKAITTWRFQHGTFATIDDLMKISTIDEKVFLRIKPYLTLE